MADTPEDFEVLLADVRKTISENKLFLDRLVNEAIETDSEEEPDVTVGEEDFEEL